MITADRELFYWRTNEDWYEYDKETNSLKIVDTAPKRAKKSYQLYQEHLIERKKREEEGYKRYIEEWEFDE